MNFSIITNKKVLKMLTKYCYYCREALEILLFSKDSSSKDGLNSGCKPCEKIRQGIYLNSLTNEERHLRSLKTQEWKKRNKGRTRKYEKTRKQTDTAFRLECNLRSRLNKIVRGLVKSGSAVKDLGCSGAELKSYLESLWEPWMNWNNYGIKPGFWSIDHIIPLSSVDLSDREQFLKVSHYSNLRPLLHKANLIKSDKVA